ncbi:MAG TPA: CorA family divalent cation transporter [Candidatus Paceibacterota bacterium]|nr:CorA family divalent cation transporter [Candidatus Paceibacterota bacterium]
MITRHERSGMTWIDLEAPSREELRSVVEEFGIDPEIEGEIIAPTPYPLFVTSPEHHYLILHFPTTDAAGGARNQEIDIILGKHYLITVRYEVVSTIQTLHRAFEAEELLGIPKENAGPVLVERVLRRLYAAMGEEIERIARQLDRIEADIFAGKEKKTVRSISEAGRVLLRFDTTLARHEEPLKTFLGELQTSSFFGKGFAAAASRIEAERAHTASLVTAYRAVARELRTTNDSLLSSSQNDVMKVFTVITVAFLPLTLIAGLFGMHTVHEPILGSANDFWIVIGLMVLVEFVLMLFLKWKRWI